MKLNKKSLTADQKKILALENRIEELEQRLNSTTRRFKVGQFVNILGCIVNIDSEDPETGECEVARPYLVEIRWETEEDFPNVWLPEEAFNNAEDHR